MQEVYFCPLQDKTFFLMQCFLVGKIKHPLDKSIDSKTRNHLERAETTKNKLERSEINWNHLEADEALRCNSNDCSAAAVKYNISNSCCQKEINLRCLQVKTTEMDLQTDKKQKFNELTKQKKLIG